MADTEFTARKAKKKERREELLLLFEFIGCVLCVAFLGVATVKVSPYFHTPREKPCDENCLRQRREQEAFWKANKADEEAAHKKRAAWETEVYVRETLAELRDRQNEDRDREALAPTDSK